MAEFDAFVHKAKGKVKDVATVDAKTTGELVNVYKFKIQEIRSLYEQLGRAVYQMRKNSLDNDELIDSLQKEIDEQLCKLAKVDELLCEAKNQTICPCCHTKNSKDAVYCSGCGTQLRDDFTPEAEATEADAEAEVEAEPAESAAEEE